MSPSSSNQEKVALMLSYSASRRSSHSYCRGPLSSGSASSARARKYWACSLLSSSASPFCSSFSLAHSWTVSSITKRGSSPGPSSSLRRLLSTSDSTPSKTSTGKSPSASQTAPMASRVRPPREHREPGKEHLLALLEEGVAPLHRGPEG